MAKKILFMIVAALVALCLNSCGNDDPEVPTPDVPGHETPTTPDEPENPDVPENPDEPVEDGLNVTVGENGENANGYQCEVKEDGIWLNHIFYKFVGNHLEVSDYDDFEIYNNLKGEVAFCESITYRGTQYYVRMIQDYCFKNSSKIKKVIIPKSMNEIGDYAFYKSSIEEVNLGDGATILNIGNSAFCESSIEKVSLGDCATILNIGFSAFNECASLVEVELRNKSTTIKNYAFEDCPNLKKLTFRGVNTGNLFGQTYDTYFPIGIHVDSSNQECVFTDSGGGGVWWESTFRIVWGDLIMIDRLELTGNREIRNLVVNTDTLYWYVDSDKSPEEMLTDGSKIECTILHTGPEYKDYDFSKAGIKYQEIIYDNAHMW